MRCVECGAEFDEMNESQPVCPGCGAVPEGRRDGADVCALLEDAAAIASAQSDREEDQGAGLDIDQPIDASRIPVDFQEAADDAEALLQATGFATFDLPEGFRFFRLPTERVM
jgi:hypothetical protein